MQQLPSLLTIIRNFVQDSVDSKTIEDFLHSVNTQYRGVKVIIGVAKSISISTKGLENVHVQKFSSG